MSTPKKSPLVSNPVTDSTSVMRTFVVTADNANCVPGSNVAVAVQTQVVHNHDEAPGQTEKPFGGAKSFEPPPPAAQPTASCSVEAGVQANAKTSKR